VARLATVLIPAVARLMRSDEDDLQSDAELLRRFVDARDECAFEALVRRHGAMVFGVCVRVLGRGGDADDAFQATFLALVRRADSVGGSFAGWLYRVARRVAVRMARQRSQRVTRERRAARPEAEWPVEADDTLARLDREVDRLPARFREAFVLCHLEERRHEDAARELGCPLGTLHSRLARAKSLLRSRLGASFPVVAVGVLSVSQVRAAVGAAVAFVEGTGAVRVAALAALSHGGWKSMTTFTSKFVAAGVLAAVAVGSGVGVFGTPAAVAVPVQPAKPADPTLEELKHENERLRREVADLKQKLAGFEGRMTIVGDAPSDAEVLRAMPRTPRGLPFPYETFRDDIKIVKNKLVDRLDPPRDYPLVGRARLRHLHWECSVYYTETIQVDFPFPIKLSKPRVSVVYLDKDALIVGEK
jgi:RNA polymerase sigma factor (sigma-70 family)